MSRTIKRRLCTGVIEIDNGAAYTFFAIEETHL